LTEGLLLNRPLARNHAISKSSPRLYKPDMRLDRNPNRRQRLGLVLWNRLSNRSIEN